MLRDRFATLDRIPRIRAPTARHCRRSRQHRADLAEPARVRGSHEPKSLLVIPDADHNDEALLHRPEMIGGIFDFSEPSP